MVPKNYFKLQKVMFKIMGISTTELDDSLASQLYRIYSVFFLTFCIYLFIATEIIDLIVKWGDLDNMTFNLCYLVTHFSGLCKAVVIILESQKIRNFCDQLESGYFLPNRKRGGLKEYEIISKAVQRSNIQTYIFYTFVTIIVANRGFYAGLDNGYFKTIYDAAQNVTTVKHYKTMPYTTWFPFDINKSLNYEIAFTYQIFSCLVYGLLIGTCDSLIAGFMVHLRAQLIILKYGIQNCINRAKEDMKEEIKINNMNKLNLFFKPAKIQIIEKLNPRIQKCVKHYLRQCIIHHQEIIKLVEVAESKFSILMLIQFLGSLALLCFQLFQISMNDVNTTRFFSMVCYVCLMLFQLLIYCWNGNEVEVESLDVANAIYNFDWILCDTEIQKATVLIIQRSHRSLKLSAGKFAYLTLMTYMSILRASGSYYMVLREVNE